MLFQNSQGTTESSNEPYIDVVFSDNKVNRRLTSHFLKSSHCILPSSLRSGFLPITEEFIHSIHILCHHMQTFLSFSFLLAFWVWLFVVEMKNLKNNAYSIQKLWMGEWRCQLYVHYMFWCNQKHWEYVVLRCKNKSISDIAVLLLKIKPLQNCVSRRQSMCESIVLGFLSCDIISCLLGPHSQQLTH